MICKSIALFNCITANERHLTHLWHYAVHNQLSTALVILERYHGWNYILQNLDRHEVRLTV